MCFSGLEGYQELAAGDSNAEDEVCEQGDHWGLSAGGEQACGVGWRRPRSPLGASESSQGAFKKVITKMVCAFINLTKS